jgi:Beta/Gamma crystallin
MKDNQHEQLFTESTDQFEATAFTELDDEVAATCSGGIVRFDGPNPDVILYEHTGLGGKSLGINATLNDGDGNLDNARIGSGWNNRTSSIKIIRGTWQLFRDGGYQGPKSERGPGRYNTPRDFGQANDALTGIRRIA